MLDDAEVRSILANLSRDIVRLHDSLWKSIPVGSILCIHEETDIELTVESYQTKFIINQRVHVIRNANECTEPVRKTQYGPKE